MLISRKPYCNNCQNRGSAYGPTDYVWYPCSKGEEIDKIRNETDKIWKDLEEKIEKRLKELKEHS